MNKSLVIFLFLSSMTWSQSKVNSYKYVIVPAKFDFVTEKDQYQTSSLSKFLFEKYGFTAFLDTERLPEEVVKNRCLALTGVVVDNSGMFVTKMHVELRDCTNNIIHTLPVGRSKSKEYKKAYHEAIRQSFLGLQSLNYKYTPEKEISSSPKNNVENKVVSTLPNKEVAVNSGSEELLYAQPILNGFQLVDTKPVKIFEILKTENPDIYILKNRKGILYNRSGLWRAEYYANGKLITKNYRIKF